MWVISALLVACLIDALKREKRREAGAIESVMNLDAPQVAVLSQYREFSVPPNLVDYFVCFWKQAVVGSQAYAHRVLPDACVDIVFINK